MKYATARAFRAAIEERLKQHASKHNLTSLDRARKDIAFDRLLARLIVIDPANWILKGGVALEYRLGDRSRATKDMDLHHDQAVANADAVFAEAILLEMPDYFEFDIERTHRLDSLTDGVAVRYRVTARLDGRTFETFVVDVGFDDATDLPPDILQRPGFLEFADIAPPRLPVLAIEVHLAEKLHAYARSYSGDRPSSRVKDLVDLVLIGQNIPLRASTCRDAIRQTFTFRDVHEIPVRLELPPAAWATTYPNMARSVSLDPDIVAGHAFAAQFLDPLLDGEVSDDATWDPRTATWR